MTKNIREKYQTSYSEKTGKVFNAKSCPFCGEDTLFVYVNDTTPNDIISRRVDLEAFVECEPCGAQGPFFYETAADQKDEIECREKLIRKALNGWGNRVRRKLITSSFDGGMSIEGEELKFITTFAQGGIF